LLAAFAASAASAIMFKADARRCRPQIKVERPAAQAGR
jgi:hypothetical protein